MKKSCRSCGKKVKCRSAKPTSEEVWDSFGEIFTQFGNAVGKVFDDPKLKAEANKLGKHAVKSAKTFGRRFKDEEVKEKFRQVGNAANKFGNNVKKYVNKNK